MALPDEHDIEGLDVENSYLRRLYRILNMPTSDLAFSKDKLNKQSGGEDKKKKKDQARKGLKKFIDWCRKCCADKEGYGHTGFKSIQKKSLHFSNSRFRENLMEIAMLCRENAIDNFLENIGDMEILFKSMSPAETKLFDSAFKRTRFTDSVQNADWRIGDTQEVIGMNTSDITEKLANKLIKKSQKRLF